MAVVEDFRGLHHSGTFVMPNAWDIGSARILAGLGFPALATTSSGHAASLGKRDQQVTLDELLVHAEQLAAAVDVPLSIDAERCFADTPAGVAETVSMLAETGAAGCSIEDFDPSTGGDRRARCRHGTGRGRRRRGSPHRNGPHRAVREPALRAPARRRHRPARGLPRCRCRRGLCPGTRRGGGHPSCRGRDRHPGQRARPARVLRRWPIWASSGFGASRPAGRWPRPPTGP